MAAIRVIISDMPLLLRSLVEGILDGDPRFDIVSRGMDDLPRVSRGVETLPPDQGSPGFDVLVISEDAMIQTLPHLGILGGTGEVGMVAISPDGLDAAVLRVEAHRRKLDDEPRQSLSLAILDAAGRAQGFR